MEKINTNELARMIADDLTEVLKVKGHRTVPRQTNPAPDESNVPPCESNIASRDTGAQASEEAVEAVLSGGTVLNPYSYNEMEIPKVGDRVFMVYASTDGLAVLADYFHGTAIELLLLAQNRLFTDRKDAEAYLKECRGVIGSIVAQLAVGFYRQEGHTPLFLCA